ncbi:multidrug resistance-associated protein 1-like [Ylistrum balloti]|uniref:multidrug resistance-associated protein 1-like n=1 Tax=Ylistrum balloti TaxID=509963 RepID=UPI002905D62B|nr:multidrug resistance-associated protein 1-like [Ylistrum balloti]
MVNIEDFCGKKGGAIWDNDLLFNNTYPQFTECSQNTLLVWVPCGFLWFTLPFYLYGLCTSNGIPLPLSSLNITKTFLSLVLFIVTAVEMVRLGSDKADNHKEVPTAQFVAGSIKAASFALTALLIQLEKRSGFITSGILFLYWLLMTIAGIVPFYSKIIQKVYEDDLFTFIMFYVYWAALCLQLILHCIAEKVTRRGYNLVGEKPCPEISSSFLSRLVFWWMNPLVLSGYKKDLKEDDIWNLNPRDAHTTVNPKFSKAWKAELDKWKIRESTSVVFNQGAHIQEHRKASEKTPLLRQRTQTSEVEFHGTKVEKKKNKASLFRVLVRVYGLDFLRAWGCKFLYDLLQFVSPTLLGVLIAYTDNKANEQAWKGYVFAASFFVVAFVQSLCFHQNFHIGMTTGMRIRSALITAVYKKSLCMNSEAKKQKTVGEIVNLMSVDCQRMQDLSGYLWMLWSAPVQIILAMWLLWNQLGPSVLAGLGVMILLIPLNMFISIKQRALQVNLMKLKDKRLKLMSEVLNGMKVLKLYAWEPSFQEKILELRNKELDILKKYAYLQAFSTFSFTCAPFLVTLATFATYILASNEHYLDAGKAFVSLSLFNILRFPINLLPMMVSYIVQANVSIGRIADFLKMGDLDPENVQHNRSDSAAIVIKDGTFTWDENLTPALRGINLTADVGKLIAVVGQVGCGKSSLISSILGDMEKLRGRVNVKGSVAYVPQQAWIQNATVQDNILFGSEMNQCTYDDVLDACALRPDLEILTAGDMTEIGEKGINLSGGQKQRVSLARAVYNNADIYLLDDPLSAVDSHVGKHIFQKVVGSKGLLRNKTRLLVTHGIHWLPMVDSIIVLVDGQVSEMGSYEELLDHDGAFAQFLKTYLTQDNEDDAGEDDPEIQEVKSKILQRLESVTSDTATSGDESHIRARKRKTSESKPNLARSISTAVDAKCEKTAPVKTNKEKDVLIKEETQQEGAVKRKIFMRYARAVGLLATLIIFLLFICYQGASVGSNIWLSVWTDDKDLANVSNANTTAYKNKNYTYLGGYAAFGIGQAFLIMVYSLLASLCQVRAAAKLHLGMLENVMKGPMSFFDTTPIGRIVNRFSRDIETIDSILPGTTRFFIQQCFGTLATFVIITYSTPIFLSVIIPLFVVYYLSQRFYVPTSRQLQRIESTTRSPIYTHFSETIAGASTIRAYGQQDRFIETSVQRVDKNILFFFARIASNRWLGTRLEFVGNLIVFAAALFAVLSNDVSSGTVGLSVSYALSITSALNLLVQQASNLETNIVSVERVQEYAETQTEAAWVLPFRRPPHDWPDKGHVRFNDYKTRYREGLDLVLRGVNCEIQGGQKVGIVGRTGAGKSSLTVALFRLIEPAGGSIVIDGQSIANMGLHDLRSKLTILPQDPVLFSGTLRMNLDPFDVYTDDQLWKAIEHAHLKKFVSDLPEGLMHECGEGGENLSVGQRQLVCLARTLLRKTKILILDEATAAVDMETDDLIQNTIRTEFKDCTIFTIAHRLNTIMDYDRVMVLDQGLIKEFDSPDNLIKNKSSAFYSMAKDANLV